MKILTPEGFRPILRIVRSRRKYSLKLVTYDGINIDCDKRQYFFLRDASYIRSDKIKKDMWLKTRRGFVRIKKVVQVYDPKGIFSLIEPSSFGGRYYLANGILTAYRL
jgi:hypothetical protein